MKLSADICDWKSVKNCFKEIHSQNFTKNISIIKNSGKDIFDLRDRKGKLNYSKYKNKDYAKIMDFELGKDKIRVNAILPGLVAGDRQQNVMRNKAQKMGKSFKEVEQEAFSFTSIKEYVKAQDIADQIMYLTSDAGKHISGQAISIDCDTKMLL